MASGTGGTPVPPRHAADGSERTALAAGRIPTRAVPPAVHGRRAVRHDAARPWCPPANPAEEMQPFSPAHSVNKSARTLPHHPSLHGQTVATAQLTFSISLIPHRRPFARDTNETSPPEQKWLIQDFSHRCRKGEREKSTHYWQVSLVVVSDSYPWKLSRQFGVATVFTPSHTIATPKASLSVILHLNRLNARVRCAGLPLPVGPVIRLSVRPLRGKSEVSPHGKAQNPSRGIHRRRRATPPTAPATRLPRARILLT